MGTAIKAELNSMSRECNVVLRIDSGFHWFSSWSEILTLYTVLVQYSQYSPILACR